MPLIVEDGSCVAGADSFVSLAGADSHFANYGGFWAGDDPDKESALRRAALWLSTYIVWDGSKACGGNMLAWPRAGVTDCDGNAVADNVVPQQVIFAQLAAASVELQSPGAMTPSVTTGKQTKRVKVDVIEEEYMTPQDMGVPSGTYDPIAASRQVLTQVNDLIKCFATVPGRKVPWPKVV